MNPSEKAPRTAIAIQPSALDIRFMVLLRDGIDDLL
jgi:hypothetical protein